MSKLNKTLRGNTRQGVVGAIKSEVAASGKTGNGADGFARDAKGELFLLATANFVGEDTFYEAGGKRDERYANLVRQAAAEDAAWTLDFLTWLRTDANMRTASIVGAIEAAKVVSARMKANGSVIISKKTLEDVTPRKFVDAVLVRADEPGEALAYWLATYGRPLPKWLTRGLGDAVLRLYTPFNVLKWDSDRNAVRFADVLEFTQIAKDKGAGKEELFKFLLDDRRGRGNKADSGVQLLAGNATFNAVPVEQRRSLLTWPTFPQVMKNAGVTWESLSGWLQGPMDAKAWESLIEADAMGYMALIRNLRNFDQAGISKAARQKVADILTKPQQVERSRQLPMRFLSAYNNVENDFWKPVLDEAATHALRNVPKLAGRTLVLVDTSGSMNTPFSTAPGRQQKPGQVAEKLMRWDAAALFGVALGYACEQADVVSFSGGGYYMQRAIWQTRPVLDDDTQSKLFPLNKGENLLKAVQRFGKTHFLNGGTDTAGAVQRWFKGHDRIVLLTDEQANSNGGVFQPVPPSTPTYTFNLAGYKYGHAASGPNRYVVGGLSDAGFKMIATLESRQSGKWPWDN